MIVRQERPADHDAVRRLHSAAFRSDTGAGDVVEAVLVDHLRTDAGFLPHLSLVAVEGPSVVGHVIATRGRLDPAGTPVLGLGPLAVLPAAQGRGIGTVLVHALLAVAEATGETLVCLLGEERYYARFDFVPAADLGITPPDPAWGPHFQARRLGDDGATGRFRYAEPFTRL